ncbi:hypothetical protein CHY_0332 [Carboxydothermus hydrogenoformans Z-2901]|uniref:Uncharacterized protein n=1 Tax=Carboxydothermus hydrogenoformans (strain ATCC BAA-161 / DSM 6008 / Z-2901) TaxID=246194 RepID=Q3AF89_CARHZ|nr:hypothetical protein CHY_0332 [Carboxydothermus hydrogenoformans Z-2901]
MTVSREEYKIISKRKGKNDAGEEYRNASMQRGKPLG